MDYKKEYEQAIERARVWKEKSGMPVDRQGILDDIFPELKESEDERIRKSLIKSYTNQHPANFPTVDGFTREQILAWLEKRAGQKTVSKTEPIVEGLTSEFQKQVSHLIASAINKEHKYNQGYVKWTAKALLNYAKHELEKQDEHKCDCKYVGCHVNNMKRWCHKKQSEILYEKCNIKCSEYLKQGEQNPAWSEEDERMCKNLLFLMEQENSISSWEGCYEWLESLKERYTWKPSIDR